MILASDPLAPFGQAGALIVALYMFVSILVGLALAAGRSGTGSSPPRRTGR